MLTFTWEYDYARGGAVVHATPSEGGEREELAQVNNGNVAQLLCDALASECEGKRDGACLSWLGYVNPPRPVVTGP
jgi:hypothetical protein